MRQAVQLDWTNVTLLFLFSFLILGIGLLLFKTLWLRDHGFFFKKGNYEFKNSGTRSQKITSFEDYYHRIKTILMTLDHEYWIKNTGFDGYVYISFTRRMAITLTIFSVIAAVLYFFTHTLVAIFEKDYGDINRIMDTPKYRGLQEFYTSGLLLSVTILTINSILHFRENLQATFYDHYTNSNHEKGLNWLKMRTVQLDGKKYLDLDGKEIKEALNQYLVSEKKEGEHSGQVLKVLVIPNLKNLIDLEIRRKKLMTTYNIVKVRPPNLLKYSLICCCDFFYPKYLRQEQEFERELRRIDYQIDKSLLNDTSGSTTAFLSLDSFTSVHSLMTYYNESSLMRKLKLQVNQKGKAFLLKQMNRNKQGSLSGYLHSEEEDQYIDFDVSTKKNASDKVFKQAEYKLKAFPHPRDINWRNIGQPKTEQNIRTTVINIILVVILVFLSTPAAMIELLKKSETIEKVRHVTYDREWPAWMKYILTNLLPPLFIIIINQFIIYLIFLLSGYEKNSRFSKYQLSILNKSFFYLIFNMLIVPGFAAPAGTSLFTIISEGIVGVEHFIHNFFAQKSGDFFVGLILQSAAFGFLFSINMITDLTYNYFSTFVTYNYRLLLSDDEPWRKEEWEVFYYGYYYAQNVTILAIAFYFATEVPFLSLCAAFYFLCRLVCDAHRILLIHKYEIESSGILIHSTLKKVLVALLFCQITSFIRQVVYGFVMSSIFLVFLIGYTAVVAFFFWRPLLSPEIFPDARETLNETLLSKWWGLYSHPLVVSPQTIRPNKGKINQINSQENMMSFLGGTSMFASGLNVNNFTETNKFSNRNYIQMEEVDEEEEKHSRMSGRSKLS